jgi:hypothetical protein
MRKLPKRRDYFQPKVAQRWPSAKTIPRVMEMAKNSGWKFAVA